MRDLPLSRLGWMWHSTTMRWPRGAFDEGPARCVICGVESMRRGRFFAAFPDRHRNQAGFPLSQDPPPVKSWRMTECQHCENVSPLPYPSDQEITDFYTLQNAPNEWEIENYVRLDFNSKALSGVKQFVTLLTEYNDGPGRLLEVGCAAGWVLKAAGDLGWKVKGIEGAPKFSDFARNELGLDIFSDMISRVNVAKWSQYDLILAFDVFEHLHDPVRDLSILRELAAPNASLLITAPNISSICAKLYGTNWRQIVPSHINYSTPKSISYALERAGWKILRVSEPRYWDPDLKREEKRKKIELAKFICRAFLRNTIMPVGEKVEFVRNMSAWLSSGRLTWNQISYRVGDQAVLGDVMLVIAQPL